MPISSSTSSLRLVSIVTAMTSGAGRDARGRFLVGRSRAARIMASPPDAWTFTIQTPSRVAAATAPRDGVRDVVELQIEKHAIAARDQFLDDRRPVAGEQAAADLEPADGAAKAVGQAPRFVGAYPRRARLRADPFLVFRARVDRPDQIGDARDVMALHVVADAVRAASAR